MHNTMLSDNKAPGRLCFITLSYAFIRFSMPDGLEHEERDMVTQHTVPCKSMGVLSLVIRRQLCYSIRFTSLGKNREELRLSVAITSLSVF